MTRLGTAIAVAMMAAPAAPAMAQSTTDVGLDGRYASIACEVRPQQTGDGSVGEWWLTREITIADDRIEAVFTTYAGPGCDAPIQTLSFAGRVDIVGPSAVIDGAFEADLTIDEFVRITPLAQSFADFLNGAPDGACLSSDWTIGVERDILSDGCLFLGVQPNTPTVEYEILAIRDDVIHFGARPVDGSFITSPDIRPMALLVGAARL